MGERQNLEAALRREAHQAEQLRAFRLELGWRREMGEDFEDAWRNALERCVPRERGIRANELRHALTETRGAWRRAYDREPGDGAIRRLALARPRRDGRDSGLVWGRVAA